MVSQPYPLVTALQSLVANSKRKSSLTDQYDSLTSSAMYELYGIVGTMRSTLERLTERDFGKRGLHVSFERTRASQTVSLISLI